MLQPHAASPYESHSSLALEPSQFEVIRDVLARYSGVIFDKVGQRTFTAGLANRIKATGLSPAAYISSLTRPTGRYELQQLAEQILNHETIFFRNQPHIRALRDVVLPQLHRRLPPNAPLRIWSAGCSTGEEAYSLAIIVLEALGMPLPRPVQILGTDLSEAALDKARRGCYRGRTLSNITPDLLARHFEPHHDCRSVAQHVRDLVEFHQLNLLDPFPTSFQGINIIFCQNVTIYFQIATFRQLVDRFYRILPDGGMLFLGFSETLWNVCDTFRLQEIDGAFFYMKDPSFRTTNLRPKPAPLPMTTATPPAPIRPPSPAAPPKQWPRPAARPLLPALPDSSSSQSKAPEMIARATDLLALGQAEEALTILTSVPMDGQHAPQVLALIARAHANRGDHDLAVAEARRAIELDTLTTDAYVLLGVLYAQQHHFSLAAQQLERARYLDPDSALISFHLAETYRRLQRPRMALREYRNTIRKLSAYAPDTLLDGVAVAWIRETCERYGVLLAAPASMQ